MRKLLLAWIGLPLSWAALAADDAAANAPAEMVDEIYVVIFGIIFLGMIVGFFAYFWWVEKKKKDADR